MYTITLDRMMGFPSSTTKRLQQFLSITPNPDTKKNRVDMKDLPLALLDRISAASALVQSIAPAQELQELVSRVMDDEVSALQDSQDDSCRPLIPFESKDMAALYQ